MEILVGLAWLGATVTGERIARRHIGSRALGWIVTYASVAIAVVVSGVAMPSPGKFTGATAMGIVLALAGYPLGRWVLHDKPTGPPSDPLPVELAALAGFVAVAEELVWGALVEPGLGVTATAGLFAIKHPLVDGRWRRILGLFLFWIGLGLVRAWSWPVTMALHVVLNAAGVLLGHRAEADQF